MICEYGSIGNSIPEINIQRANFSTFEPFLKNVTTIIFSNICLGTTYFALPLIYLDETRKNEFH